MRVRARGNKRQLQARPCTWIDRRLNSLPNLPPQLQQAVAQVLAQQTNLDENLTADAVKQAFQSSGLFLETSLSSGPAPLSNGVPDLKAALIVLRQALTSALSEPSENTGATLPASTPQPGALQAAATSGTTTHLAGPRAGKKPGCG